MKNARVTAIAVRPSVVFRRLSRWLLIPVLMSAVASVEAEVTSVEEGGFVSEHTMVLEAEPSRAYEALTAEVAGWWDVSHSYSGEGANFSLDARAGGCFCEALPDGGSVMHMQVVFAAPGKMLRLSGGLGPLQSMAVSGAMTFAFTPLADGRSRLDYRYAVSGIVPGGLARLAEPVDRVQRGQLERLADYLEL